MTRVSSWFAKTTALMAGAASFWQVTAAEFEREIRPLFAEHCYACHGEKKQESGLRLDRKTAALKGGDHGPALVPGNSGSSLLIQVVSGVHAEIPRMPKKGEALTAAQIGVLKQWIDAGANWPEQASAAAAPDPAKHWSFQPLQRPVPPKVKARKALRNEIDAFVEARLEKEGLSLRPEADRATLIRRLSLDLLGLPPSVEEVDAFLADRSPDAYARLVERLLKSPHYGERWGRHWLDAARYADSNGFEKDRTRSIWPYRDWVIGALNRDLPFDQFTKEQLAGDLLPGSTPEQRVATGFLRNSMLNQEGGIEPEKFRTETMIDRVDAVGRTWLGLTIGCAQCHSHKYDPISIREYYQFYDFLNQDDEPKLEVPSAAQASQRREIEARVRSLENRMMESVPDLDAKLERWLESTRRPEGEWTVVDAKEWHSQPMKFEKQEDGSLLGGGDIYNNSVLRIWWDTPVTNITAFRLEALNHANLPFNGPGIDGNGQFQLCEFTVDASPLNELSTAVAGPNGVIVSTNHVSFKRAAADAEAPGWEVAQAIDGVTDRGGWAADFTRGRRNQERRAIFETSAPAGIPGGSRFLIALHCKPKDSKLSNFMLGRVRVSYSTRPGGFEVDPVPEALRTAAAGGRASWTPELRRSLFQIYRFSDPALAASNQEWDGLWKDWPAAESSTLGLVQRPVRRVTRIFKRGDWTRPTDAVTAATPAVLPPLPAGAPANRLGLAQWLVDDRNPLTPRVMMNRVWQHYFGQGFVLTPEDLGTRSDPPSHPELLDWLGTEFVRQKWSLKAMHRLIVTSATYRQRSEVTPALLEKDPSNRWLSRGPRFRVDAEVVQDIALKSSGLLNPKIGGPSVFPALPEGVMQISYGPIPWNVSEGEDRYRRALYTFWKRSVPYPSMITFDAPTAEQSCVRRVRSNTPLQALTTLNEPTFTQAARWLAWGVLNEHAEGDEARLVKVFRRCVSRVPDKKEVATLSRLLRQAEDEFASKPKDAGSFAFADPKNPPPLPEGVSVVRLAAWTSVARAVLNLDETITKE